MDKSFEMRLAIMESAAHFWKHGKQGVPETAYRIATLLQHLKERHHLDTFTAGEHEPVVGSHNLDKIAWNLPVAEMIAVAPGLVICNILPINDAAYCSGFVEKGVGGLRYEVITFAGLNRETTAGNAWIRIGPGFSHNTTAAAVFEWGFGFEEGSCVGITPHYWAIMQTWLNRWLAPEPPIDSKAQEDLVENVKKLGYAVIKKDEGK